MDKSFHYAFGHEINQKRRHSLKYDLKRTLFFISRPLKQKMWVAKIKQPINVHPFVHKKQLLSQTTITSFTAINVRRNKNVKTARTDSEFQTRSRLVISHNPVAAIQHSTWVA